MKNAAKKKSSAKKRQTRAQVRRRARIDRPQLLRALGRLDHAELLDFLGELMALLPDAKLRVIGGQYVDVPEHLTSAELLSEIRRFDAVSRAGEFYEAFHVNSRNFADLSPGTERWIGDIEALYRRIVAEIPALSPADTREMLALISGLMHEVDDDNDIVFWADEGGSWHINIDWKELIGYWLRALAATADPIEYAQAAVTEINQFSGEERERYIRIAKKHATHEQRKALQAQRT